MVGLFVIIGLALILIFYRDVLAWLMRLYSHATLLQLEPTQALILRSQNQKVPKLWLIRDDQFSVESFSIDGLFQRHIFVGKNFWKSLDQENQDALIIWHYSLMTSTRFLGRLLIGAKTQQIDRSCLLWGCPALVLAQLLETALQPRSLKAKQSLLRGLSLESTAFYLDRKGLKERLDKISWEAARLKIQESL